MSYFKICVHLWWFLFSLGFSHLSECELVCDGEDGAYFLDPDSCLCVTGKIAMRAVHFAHNM